MAKPIFVAGIPISENLSFDETKQVLDDINNSFQETMKSEYFTLVYATSVDEEPKFQVFYEKDFNEVKYEELKEIIKSKLTENV